MRVSGQLRVIAATQQEGIAGSGNLYHHDGNVIVGRKIAQVGTRRMQRARDRLGCRIAQQLRA